MKQAWSWKLFGPLGLGMLAIVALATSCAGVAGGGSPVAQVPTGPNYIPNSISVSGVGDANGTPDIAYVSLGVNVVNKDVGVAVSEAAERMQALMDAMKQAGIAEEDMQTVGFNVWPEDKYDPQSGQPTGDRVYHVDNMLSIKVRDLATTGSVIEAGLNAGANTVAGLSFSVDDTTALEAEARREAVENARARAQQLAEALGVTLGQPIMAIDGGGGFPQPVYAAGMGGGMGMDSAAAAAPAITPGQLTVSSTVTIVFAIEQ